MSWIRKGRTEGGVDFATPTVRVQIGGCLVASRRAPRIMLWIYCYVCAMIVSLCGFNYALKINLRLVGSVAGQTGATQFVPADRARGGLGGIKLN